MHVWVGGLGLGLMLVLSCSRPGRLGASSARGLMCCAYHMLAHARAHAARSAGMCMHMQSPLHPSAGLNTCLEVCADLPARAPRAPPMHDGHHTDTRGGRSSWVPHTCTHG